MMMNYESKAAKETGKFIISKKLCRLKSDMKEESSKKFRKTEKNPYSCLIKFEKLINIFFIINELKFILKL